MTETLVVSFRLLEHKAGENTLLCWSSHRKTTRQSFIYKMRSICRANFLIMQIWKNLAPWIWSWYFQVVRWGRWFSFVYLDIGWSIICQWDGLSFRITMLINLCCNHNRYCADRNGMQSKYYDWFMLEELHKTYKWQLSIKLKICLNFNFFHIITHKD